MSQVMLEMSGVGKEYRLGQYVGGGRSRSFRESLTKKVQSGLHRWNDGNTFQNSEPETLWALRDVSFELRQGEVLGIVGRNGAGKTTLLKILSRITEPTEGRVVLRGRVASLLEVGTGFHQELTGRENVFLNGVILGMSRHEVRRKFDEIVEFSGVSAFLDTPVKRYSSGMKVRLAFAVAAHLDPEILIIDEVLAVGDAAFQAKCLGKLESVAQGEGRTILFVSHNMGVVRTLCSRGLYLEGGRVLGQGPVEEQISRYLGTVGDISALTDLSDRQDRLGHGGVRILSVRTTTPGGSSQPAILSGQPLRIELQYEATKLGGQQEWAVSIFNTRGEKICHLDSEDRGGGLPALSARGMVSVVMPKIPLLPGVYTGDLRLKVDGAVADYVQGAFAFRVEAGDFFDVGRISPPHGQLVFIEHTWEVGSGRPPYAH